MIETTATVETNDEIAPGYRLITLRFDHEIRARAGQFAMLRAHAWFEPLLRRALAVYRQEGPRALSFLYQVMGRGTEILSQVKPGGQVDALVPLGNSWPVADVSSAVPPRAIPPRAIVVAGGIGSASILMLAHELAGSKVESQILFGAASARVAEGCGLRDIQATGLPLTITTDDGSLGLRGFVTIPLERLLEEGRGADATIYACGPWAMMKSVARIAERYGVRCLVSLEAPMGCGFGVCVGCVVAVKTGEPLGYGSYKRVCVDGSIFPADKIDWEVNAMSH
jgi:dihydroorotate dehydrogenase electron transfer subunit